MQDSTDNSKRIKLIRAATLHYFTQYLSILVTAVSSPVGFVSFIPDISIASLQVHYYSEALPTHHEYCRSFTSKHNRQLRVKDLPKVPTWWLELDSIPLLSGRQLLTTSYMYANSLSILNYLLGCN